MEKTIQVLKSDGTEAESLAIRPGWIELEKGSQAVHDEVVALMAGQRNGNAATKNRAAVRGSSRKPYRQKGTGRARAGTVKSGLWRGGGVIFGPSPRDYGKKVNKKVKRLALKRSFSERLNEDAVIVLDEFAVKEPKTRQVVNLLEAVGAGENVLLVVEDPSRELILSTRNLPNTRLSRPEEVNTYWMLLHAKVVFTKAALERFTARFCPEEQQ